MEYEGRICRAPMERSAYKLPVMVGCVYNQCRFCDLFKHLKFRMIPLDSGRMLARLDDVIEEYYDKQDICSVIGPEDTFEILSAY